MKCSDPCGLVTAWTTCVTAIRNKVKPRKRTSIDGVIIEELHPNLSKASHERWTKRLSGNASTIYRGTALTASELEGLRRSYQIPNETIFDAEEATDDTTDNIILRPKPALMRTDLKSAKEDANELDEAEIESLVSTLGGDPRYT